MNSGSNSSRNLTASGDLVISLFLSHKAHYQSRAQAYTNLYADTAARKHTHTHTLKHMHSLSPSCSLLVFLFISGEEEFNVGATATRAVYIHQDLLRCIWKQMRPLAHKHTRLLFSHRQPITDAHLQKQRGIISAMNPNPWLFKCIPPSPSSESETLEQPVSLGQVGDYKQKWCHLQWRHVAGQAL